MNENTAGGKVLIVGASGLVGSAAVEHFLASDRGWEVVAMSRRTPAVTTDRHFEHVACDLRDADATREVLGRLRGVTHVVYSALFEKAGLATGWHDTDYLQTNAAMLRNVTDGLDLDHNPVEHFSTLQGTKAYGFHLGPMTSPARERQPRHPHENFYWEHEDHIRALADQHGWRWTVLRPHLVTGGSVGVAMNLVPVVGAFAALCRELDLPFGFPGGNAAPWEATDARVVASALEWAGTSPNADREIFNVTNGEMFSWRDLWPFLADRLGVSAAGDAPVPLAEFLPANAEAWERVVAKHDLQKLSIGQILGESHHLADLVFAYGAEEPPPTAFVSSIKIRRAGFGDCMDSEDMWSYWIARMQRARLLPGN